MKLVQRLKKLLAHVRGLRKEEGLTLIEVLAVVVILGIIAAIAVPAVSKAIDSAKVGSTVSTLGELQTALDRYYFDEGQYPKQLSFLIDSSVTSGSTTTDANGNGTWQGPYLQNSSFNDSWNNAILYAPQTNTSSNDVTGYILLSGDGTALTPGTTSVKVGTATAAYSASDTTTSFLYASGGTDSSGNSIAASPTSQPTKPTGTLQTDILGSVFTNN